ncbi:MAG: hypothetical protein H6Q52_3474, partial [Deltaproteobacteria bacterium]|nr:hypothetical protein [Deltaproteobacteria bacterium]
DEEYYCLLYTFIDQVHLLFSQVLHFLARVGEEER